MANIGCWQSWVWKRPQSPQEREGVGCSGSVLTGLIGLTPPELGPLHSVVGCFDGSELFSPNALPFVPSLPISEKKCLPTISSVFGFSMGGCSFFMGARVARTANPLVTLCASTNFAV